MEIDKAVIINALYNRIKAGDMAMEQVPDAFLEAVQTLIEGETNAETE
mgnify:CR=1 FL=1